MPFTDVIYRFSNNILVVIFVSAAVTASVLLPLIGTRLLRQEQATARAGFALDAFKLIGPVIAIFTAFTLLQAINRYREAETLVLREATEIMQLDRALRRLGPDAAPLRDALAAYGQSVVAQEWPALKKGQESAATQTLFNTLIESIHAVHQRMDIEATTREAIDDAADELLDIRALRLNAATTGLPAIFWHVLGSLIVLLAAEALLFRFDWNLVVPKAGYAAAIALLIALLVILDYPFRGEQSVGAEPITRALTHIARY
ncbi:DUF4239 domain-containing protein [Chelatococcus daeguensis]|uniref:bestrophin-like domain n=1 Tax=Chelatococcus daeguensis TaxID=444444 RepID=UPI0007ABE95A|nr:DUF4239 domain-containing protein [Chelatococcus daeguensis]KZE33764.1 hypothetical protein AVW15_18130 [Chelatococcus daeguensis]MBM3082842.1 DUF4239 domain-containing protein [Chelatococcus daeguensis]